MARTQRDSCQRCDGDPQTLIARRERQRSYRLTATQCLRAVAQQYVCAASSGAMLAELLLSALPRKIGNTTTAESWLVQQEPPPKSTSAKRHPKPEILPLQQLPLAGRSGRATSSVFWRASNVAARFACKIAPRGQRHGFRPRTTTAKHHSLFAHQIPVTCALLPVAISLNSHLRVEHWSIASPFQCFIPSRTEQHQQWTE